MKRVLFSLLLLVSTVFGCEWRFDRHGTMSDPANKGIAEELLHNAGAEAPAALQIFRNQREGIIIYRSQFDAQKNCPFHVKNEESGQAQFGEWEIVVEIEEPPGETCSHKAAFLRENEDRSVSLRFPGSRIWLRYATHR